MSQSINNSLFNGGITIMAPRYTALTIALGRTGGCFSIKATESGFDVDIPDGVSMDECAEAFVNGLRLYLKDLKL